MSSEPTPPEPQQPANAEPPADDQGLPPVEPPSAGLMVRLFLVPGLIVAGLVLLFLAGPLLYRGVSGMFGFTPADGRSAEEFLRLIDDENMDIRYRAASDLAQVLLRKDELAADPLFALALADRLEKTIDKSNSAEEELARSYDSLTQAEKAKEEASVQHNRNRVIYLTAALGNCMVPVGAPLMRKMAERASGMEPVALSERRRRALFALATLGKNLERFDKLDGEKQQEVLKQLEGEKGPLASDTRKYLEARLSGKPTSFGVIDTLITCSKDGDPFVRELSAVASSFWYGTPAENEAMDRALLRLTADDGRGQDELLNKQREQNKAYEKSWPETTRKGYLVQANATVALARRGNPNVPLDILEELLQPEVLKGLFIIRKADETHYPDTSAISAAATAAARAVPVLAEKRPDLKSKLDGLRPHLRGLVKDQDPELSRAALDALKKLGEE